jgi:lipopolysaccharide/colanic/teichoic acid biosynthesis glycosyltransferase
MNTLIPELNVSGNTTIREFEESVTPVSRLISIDSNVVLFVGDQLDEPDMGVPNYKFFFAETFDDAVGTIEQLSNVLRRKPGLIIYQFRGDNDPVLISWQQYLKKHPAYAAIPFFLYIDEMSAIIRNTVKKYVYIDEVITAACFNKLSSKTAFISKYKQLSSPPMTVVVNRSAIKIKSPKKTLNALLKRTFDILVASTALLLLSPLFLVIAAIIRFESKGAVFYAARRAGKNYKIFKFYKFRTMVADADKQLKQFQHLNQYGKNEGPVFYKVSNDPRVTRVGKFLRNSSLDEIPQLVNVLIGDMSLVGNRPLPLYEATTLTTDDWAQRFLAPAGITGLWQISKRGKKDMSADERIALDINYSHSHSFTYDMWIMVNTPKALIQKDNV